MQAGRPAVFAGLFDGRVGQARVAVRTPSTGTAPRSSLKTTSAALYVAPGFVGHAVGASLFFWQSHKVAAQSLEGFGVGVLQRAWLILLNINLFLLAVHG